VGPAVELLSRQMDEAYCMVRDRLEGLTEEEYFWEPVPGSWTLRRLPDGRWDADYAEPDPEPSPFTTIAWRINHIASCKVMYHEYAFGPRRLTFPDLPVPSTVHEALTMLDEGQRLLIADVQALEDPDLAKPTLTNWGEEWPAWRIFWTMVHHDLWHGGEIGALRDLYRHSGSP
jgi:DinB superfamily